MDLVTLLQQPLLVIWPDGGQGTARRNARAAVEARRVAAADRAAGWAALDAARRAAAVRATTSARQA